jgi:ribosomal protein L29
MYEKEIKDMTDDELKEHLAEIRLQRKTGYDRKMKKVKTKNPSVLDGINDDLAAVILEKLQKEGVI